jgi:GT2 family glycosyltransferase
VNSSAVQSGLVSIIIVNYNGEDLLVDCLNSVREQEYRNIEIIVVDNASRDNSIALIRERFPEVKLICSETNRGFTGGNNLGASKASGEYLVLLNNDTVVDQHWLTELLRTFNDNHAGVVTSKVITDEVPEQFYTMNGSVNFIGYNIMRVFSDLSTVFFAGGASLILRNDRSGTIFPEEYFLYQEDVFLSWKMRLIGKPVLMSQRSIVYHRGSATTKKQLSAFSTFYQERNRMLNALILFETKTLIKLLPYFAADAAGKIILSLFFKRKSFSGIIRSYSWLAGNRTWIARQRREIQSIRVVKDKEILRMMSSKVIDSGHVISVVLNMCSKIYSKLVGLESHD